MRVHPTGGGQVGEARLCYYAFLGIEVESYIAVIIGIISVCHTYASMLFDPGSTYSCASSYFASHLSMLRNFLDITVFVSTPVSDSIVVDRVYLYCVVTINRFDIIGNLLWLNMVDFEVILGMNRLSPYHAILDCHAKILTLAMPGLPRLESRWTLGHSMSRVVSYLKSWRTVEKGCLPYLAYI
nr:uncharacterized protein LOC117277996 [Nicotiana tomentosiformis]